MILCPNDIQLFFGKILSSINFEKAHNSPDCCFQSVIILLTDIFVLISVVPSQSSIEYKSYALNKKVYATCQSCYKGNFLKKLLSLKWQVIGSLKIFRGI